MTSIFKYYLKSKIKRKKCIHIRKTYTFIIFLLKKYNLHLKNINTTPTNKHIAIVVPQKRHDCFVVNFKIRETGR